MYERYAGDIEAMRIPETIEDAAHEILRLPTAKERAVRTLEIAAARRAGRIGRVYREDGSGAPENWRDSDGDNLRYSVWGPNRGKGGSLAKRRAIIHSLVHVESVAVELAWDIIVSLGSACDMPEEFADDFVIVAEDEARHHLLLRERLHELGWKYGDAEVTGSLWNSAKNTKHSLPARLAIEHCNFQLREFQYRIKNGLHLERISSIFPSMSVPAPPHTSMSGTSTSLPPSTSRTTRNPSVV